MNFTMNDQKAAAKLAYDLSTADDVAHCISLTADALVYIECAIPNKEAQIKYENAVLGLIKYAARHLCVSMSKIQSDIEEANRTEIAYEEDRKIFMSELNGHYEG
jgi:hypothetical protein